MIPMLCAGLFIVIREHGFIHKSNAGEQGYASGISWAGIDWYCYCGVSYAGVPKMLGGKSRV